MSQRTTTALLACLAASLLATCDAPDTTEPEPEAIASEQNALLITQSEAEALDAALDDVVQRILPALPDGAALESAVATLRASLAANDALGFARAAIILRQMTKPMLAAEPEAWLIEIGVLLHTIDVAELGVTEKTLVRARAEHPSLEL